MRARLRLRAALAALLLAAWGLVSSGCGTNFKLPTERRENRVLPGNGTYKMIATWTGLRGVSDVMLLPGPQLYLAFRGNPGRVFEFSTTLPLPIATDRFRGLLNPGALASGANSVFVLDQGDTASARATVASSYYELACGSLSGFRRPIVDLSRYWYVREYDLKGRTLRGSFTDTTFAWVNGIAADAQGRVYLSGVINACVVDRFDQRLKTLDAQFKIYRYVRGTGDRFVLGGWRRDPTFEISQGTGIGSARDPRGMHWSAAAGGAALFFADLGNDEVQKYDEGGSLSNSYKIDLCDTDTTEIAAPTDVTVDAAGFVFLIDAGNGRILRYGPDGRCIQRVDIEPNSRGVPLTRAVGIAADNVDGEDEVYVADGGAGEVVRYRRRR